MILSARPDAKGKWRYQAVKTLKEALVGADFVVISIQPGTFKEMASYVHLPEQYGIYQAALVIQNVYNQETILQAGLKKDADLAFRAFINDPLVTLDPATAKKLFVQMLQNTKQYLPGSNSEFYAIASQSPAKLKQCRENFANPKSFPSYGDLLADPNVEAVYIPLPNSLHKEWAIKAFRCGKHVLCEKPLALNAGEAQTMIREAAANQVKLMEAFMYRYTFRIKKVQELLKGGAIGEVKQISACYYGRASTGFGMRLEPTMGGGTLFDIGCYPINFIGMITGKSPIEMEADFIPQNGVDCLFAAILKYENGIIANVNCGWINDIPRLNAVIIGTKGILEIPDTFFDIPGTLILTTMAGKQEISVAACERYLLEVEDFADAIINDRPPLLSPEESLRNMKIIDRLLEKTWRKNGYNR